MTWLLPDEITSDGSNLGRVCIISLDQWHSVLWPTPRTDRLTPVKGKELGKFALEGKGEGVVVPAQES